MDISQIYLAVSIVILVLVAILVFWISGSKQESKLTPLAGLSFGFILAGILFGGERLLGYSLIAIGVVMAIVDIIKKAGKQKN